MSAVSDMDEARRTAAATIAHGGYVFPLAHSRRMRTPGE